MTSWIAPSAIEAELYEAKLKGDWPRYFDVLARHELFLAAPREHVDAEPDVIRFYPENDRQLYVWTEGALPSPTDDTVFHAKDFGWYAAVWDDREDPPYLTVNPGTPCEANLPAADRTRWTRHLQHVIDNEIAYGLPQDTVHTLRHAEPLAGPVAFGLAAGAHLSVRNGLFWNAPGYHGQGYLLEKRKLDDYWGVTTREDWLDVTERLLAAEVSTPVWEMPLHVRKVLAEHHGELPAIEEWRDEVAHAMRRSVSRTGAVRTEEELDHLIGEMQQLVGRILRYEQRFRADGLLSDGAYIRSVLAWDYGRASQMARWGLGARLCTPAETEEAVVRAGEACREVYESWEDLSVGFVLGRCLHFDEEEFGEWYQEMVTAHRELMSDPESPWLGIDFA
ncbi:DUF1266 domain-containing protein [Streptomyces sp. NPDC089799]|uniref:DUF1266 domain-containing protein n=1 Tax=Streptomyces sp. NPDC089799 TaxID=3155066 RepID=UPI00344750D7